MKSFKKQTVVVALMALLIPFTAWSSDKLTTRIHKVANFTKIEAGGVFKISFKTGELGPVIIEAEDFAHEKITVEVHGGELKLSSKNLRNLHHDIKVTITAPVLEEIDISGAASFVSTGSVKAQDFEIEASGASEVVLNLKATSVSIDASGASKINLKGQANRAISEVSGAAKVHAQDFSADDARLGVSGAGFTEMSVKENLDAEASGAGNIRYYGSPRVKSHTSGAGSIRGKN